MVRYVLHVPWAIYRSALRVLDLSLWRFKCAQRVLSTAKMPSPAIFFLGFGFIL